MSYNYRVQNDNPVHFFPLDASGFTDSITESPASVNGTPKTAPSLVVGGGTSYSLDGNNNFRFETQAFQAGSVKESFTLEAWFKPVDVSQDKTVIGHLGTSDGIIFDGQAISFVTDHGVSGRAEAKHYPRFTGKSFHVVGVHTAQRNELYVDGVRVASVDLTEEQANTNYQVVSAPGYLYSGSAPGSIIVDAVAVYDYALPTRQIKLHFLWGRDALDFKSVVSSNQGNYWALTDAFSDIEYEFSFPDKNTWESGLSASVNIIDNAVYADINEQGLSIESVWQNGFIADFVEERINGSKIEWSGKGFVIVETSINGGTTWSEAISGREVEGLYEGRPTTGLSVEVRVTFPAGQAESVSLEYLSIKLYRDRSSIGSDSNLVIDWSESVTLSSYEYQPIDYVDAMGANLYSGIGQISSHTIRVIEMFVKVRSQPDDPATLFDMRPGGDTGNPFLRSSGNVWSRSTGSTVYVNGKSVTVAELETAIPVGEWTHIAQVFPSDISAPVIIGTGLDLQLGFVATYTNPAVAPALYGYHLGSNISKVADSGMITMTDSTDAVKIYSHSWSVTGSG